MAKWKAGLAGMLILPLLMGAQSSCGSTTEKRKIRKQPVYDCTRIKHKSDCREPSKRPKSPTPTLSCKRSSNGHLTCKYVLKRKVPGRT